MTTGPLGSVITVCASGCDFNNTQLQAAIDSAVCGDIVSIAPNVEYQGPYVIAQVCTDTIRFTLTTTGFSIPSGQRVVAADATSMGRIKSTNVGSALYTRHGTVGINIIGIDGLGYYDGSNHQYGIFRFGYDGPGGGGALGTGLRATTEAQLPNFITIDRSLARGDPVGQHVWGILADAKNISIKNSRITDMHSTAFDAQCILAANTPGPISIENNYLECAGENILFGGTGAPIIEEVIPSDISILHNFITKKLSWKLACVTGAELGCEGTVHAGINWVVKNLVECKNCRRLRAAYNIIEKNWQEDQFGEAFVITPRNQASGTGGLTATAGTISSITYPVGSASTTDYYKGATIVLLTGTGSTPVWQARRVTAYNGTTRVATITPDWLVAPDSTTGFMDGWPVWAMAQDITIEHNIVRKVDAFNPLHLRQAHCTLSCVCPPPKPIGIM